MKKTKKINKLEDIETVQKDLIEMDVLNADKEGEEKLRIKGFVPAPTSLLQAIERIDMVAEDSGLEKEELEGAAPEINYLAERVGVNAIQAILLSVVVNRGEDMSISSLSNRLSISMAHALSLLTEFKKLERRFLYKIKFERPGVEARGHIWHTMIPELTDEEVEQLATSYEFSGGQIENVARKFSINNILYGDKGDRMESLFDFCDNELIQESNTQMRRVGF